ncbi:MAG: sulfatase-like hydrolase/transferase [Acidobacteria bacterium]|nr:sulfatase-like hydrolase/transferase [Acidobacteriota bacterium]
MRSLSWKDLGAAFSLSNLFFIISWKELVYPGFHHYRRPFQPDVWEYLSVIVDALLLSLIFVALIGLSKTSKRWLAPTSTLILLISGILAFGPLSSEVIKWLFPEVERFVTLYLSGAILCICVLLAARDRFSIPSIAKNLQLLALFLLPFSLLIYIEACRYHLFNDHSIFLPQTIERRDLATREAQPTGRIIWIIFDELDQALISAAKQNNTNIADLEKLAEQSFVAENAYAPNNRTQESIPALLTGVSLTEAFTISPNGLMLEPSDGTESFMFGQGNDVFSALQDRGINSGITGWYHPYCRIFQGRVANCFWSPLSAPNCRSIDRFKSCSKQVLFRALEKVPLITRIFPDLPGINFELLGETRQVQIERNQFLNTKVQEMLSNPNLGLVFFHSSVPHLPLIGRADEEGDITYYSSLEIVNETIRTVRNTLESTGQWENTVLIVSSDHAYRFKRLRDFRQLSEKERNDSMVDTRIPFIIKFAGQNSRIDYEPRINTIVTKRLILDILDNKIKDAGELVIWLDHLRRFESILIDRTSTGRPW